MEKAGGALSVSVFASEEPAVRLDPVTGHQHVLRLFPVASGHVYASAMVPAEAKAGAVVCSSVGADLLANYGRERALAHELADAGIASVRFHYRGDGNSSGRQDELTFTGMLADAHAMREWLASICDAPSVTWVGTRIGGLVAAASAQNDDSLVLWEPIDDLSWYIRGGTRARQMSSMTTDPGPSEDRPMGWREELESRGFLDLLGFRLGQPLLDSLEGITISGSPPVVARVLVVSFASRRSQAAQVAAALSEARMPVDWHETALRETWWFHDQNVIPFGDLITTTAAWIKGQEVADR